MQQLFTHLDDLLHARGADHVGVRVEANLVHDGAVALQDHESPVHHTTRASFTDKQNAGLFYGDTTVQSHVTKNKNESFLQQRYHHHLNCFWIKTAGCHGNHAPLIIAMKHTNQPIHSLGSGDFTAACHPEQTPTVSLTS